MEENITGEQVVGDDVAAEKDIKPVVEHSRTVLEYPPSSLDFSPQDDKEKEHMGETKSYVMKKEHGMKRIRKNGPKGGHEEHNVPRVC